MKANKVLEVYEQLRKGNSKAATIKDKLDAAVKLLDKASGELMDLRSAVKKHMPTSSDGSSSIESLDSFLKSISLGDLVDPGTWAEKADELVSVIDMEVNEAARTIAPESAKKQFAGLKSEIAKLEDRKLKIRDELAALVGKDDDGKKSDALRDERTKILNQIAKVDAKKKSMLKKYRGLMSK